MDLRRGLLAQSTGLALTRAGLRLADVRRVGGRVLTPRRAWLTFVLLFLTLLMVDASVEAAQWVPTPSLAVVTFWAMLTAALLAQLRANPVLLHAGGLVVGAAVVLRSTMTLVETPGGRAALEETFLRLRLWLDAASGGGISSDTLAFGLVLVTACWLVGYVSAWLVFRMRSIWGGILPGAVGLLTNLSYLPDRFFPFFFAYIVLAMLLVVWMNSMSREQEWRSRGITHSWTLSLFSLSAVLWLGAGIVLVAALLPLRAFALDPLARSYEQVRYPVEMLEHHFNRLFSGLPGYKATAIRTFGSAMPFQGVISLGDLVVFTAYSRYPGYWAARSYGTYTSQGWLDTGAEVRPWDWQPQYGQPVEYRSRMDIQQEFELNFATSTVFLGGFPQSMDREVSLVVSSPPVYTVDLRDPSGYQGLPPDLRQWAGEVQALWQANQERQEFRQAVTPLLRGRFPEETALVAAEVESEEGRVKRLLFQESQEASGVASLRLESAERLLRAEGRLLSLSVTRVQPVPPDLVAVQSNLRMGTDTRYAAQTSISIATEIELRRAWTDYPRWVTDQYLQLPDTLPDRVRQLAEDITGEVETPYDKALLIMNYLRGYEHTHTIERPPYNSDGVDYFLFEQRKGYSDYFASAMTVLMRAAGVPAKMVAGYATGTWDSHLEGYVVREKDTHAWTEVFFPDYGWIPFEPTPSQASLERGIPSPPETGRFQSERLELEPSFGDEFITDFLAGLPEDDLLLEEGGLEVPVGGRGLAVAGMLLILIAGVAVVWYILWQRATGALGSPERAYERMCRLAGMAHLSPEPAQTPYEFGRELAMRLPSVRRQVNMICDAYVRSRYGRQEFRIEDRGSLDEAWRRVRGQLVRRALRLTRR